MPLTPGHYPHQSPEQPARPQVDYLIHARPGDELLCIEPNGRRCRAVVVAWEPFAVVVTTRNGDTEPKPRGFTMDGYELGAQPPAELRPIPDDVERDRLRRRELTAVLLDILMTRGEEAYPVHELEAMIYAARRFAAIRGDFHRYRRRALERAIERESP